jgi:hypothetical protein
MQPSILLTIAAFPALLSAVMGASSKCQLAAGSTPADAACNIKFSKASHGKCITFDPTCYADMIAAGAVTATATDAADMKEYAEFFAKDAASSMKQPKLFSYFKTNIADFKTTAAGTVEAHADVFDGIKAEEFKKLDASVIKSIKPANFALLKPEIFSLFEKATATAITDAQLEVMTNDQAKKLGAEGPAAGAKAEDVKKAVEESACKALKDKADKMKVAKTADEFKTRCKWAEGSAAAIQVTLFLTFASLASVFLMNTLAF